MKQRGSKSNMTSLLMLFILSILMVNRAAAVTYTWTGAVNSSWNNSGNWSNSGPAGTPSNSSDDAIFDGTSSVSCTINVAISIKSITINAPYSGTITQSSGSTVTLAGSFVLSASSATWVQGDAISQSLGSSSGGKFTVSDGTFTGGAKVITVKGDFTYSNGNFTSTSNDLKLQGASSTFTGNSFVANGGTVRFMPGFASFALSLSSLANYQFYNVRITASGSVCSLTINNPITVSNNFNIDASAATDGLTIYGNSNKITVAGNASWGQTAGSLFNGMFILQDVTIDLTDGATGGSTLFIYNTTAFSSPTYFTNNTGTIKFSGSGSSAITSSTAAPNVLKGEGILPNISITKSAGTLALSGNITLSGDWSYNTSATINPNSNSVVDFGNTNPGALQNITVTAIGSGKPYYGIYIDNSGTSPSGKTLLKSNVALSGNVTINAGSLDTNSSPSYNISLGGNWTETSTFVPNSGLVTFTGTSGTQTVTAHTSFYDVKLNTTGSSVSLSTPISVTDNIDFTSGILKTTSSNILSVISGATATGGSASSFVDGPMIKIGNAPFTFPIGSTSGSVYSYRYLSITGLTNVTDSYTAQYFKTSPVSAFPAVTISDPFSPPIVKISGFEYWTLTCNSGSSANVKVTLSWKTSDTSDPNYITDAGLITPDLRVAEIVSGSWASVGVSTTADITGNGAAGSIQSHNALASGTGTHTLTFGSTNDNHSLPIKLSSFTAEPFNGSVQIKWETETEINNDFFSIQRSVNGHSFADILFVKSQNGNSNTVQKYSVTDNFAPNGLTYYRLKQTDFDQKVTLSEVVRVQVNGECEFSISPNPYQRNEELVFKLPGILTSSALLTISDISGKQVFVKSVKAESEGVSYLKLEAPEKIVPGIYLVVIIIEGKKFSSKLAVQ